MNAEFQTFVAQDTPLSERNSSKSKKMKTARQLRIVRGTLIYCGGVVTV
jgi:hypothetical protein